MLQIRAGQIQSIGGPPNSKGPVQGPHAYLEGEWGGGPGIKLECRYLETVKFVFIPDIKCELYI